MKGQFFVMATVILIYTLMAMIQYVYDFSDINLAQLKKVPEFYYIQYIKDTLNKTVISSNTSQDCEKLEADLIATEKFLKSELITRGINLTINHENSCSFVKFNFSLKTPEFYTFTEFKSP